MPKIALIDIDGTLIQNGQLNQALVDRLVAGGYDDFILFTQRSKYLQREQITRHFALSADSAETRGIITTPEAVSALNSALQKAMPDRRIQVQVSTSVDHLLGPPLQYYPALRTFEQGLQAKLTENAAAIATGASYDVSKFDLQVDQEKQDVKAATVGADSALEPAQFYPQQKDEQYIQLINHLSETRPELTIDLYDDRIANIQEILDSTRIPEKPNGIVVAGPVILPIDTYQQSFQPFLGTLPPRQVWAAERDPEKFAGLLRLYHTQPERIYQNFLIARAIDEAKAGKPLRFDPQGHALTEVTLNAGDYQVILEQIARDTHNPHIGEVSADPQAKLAALLGSHQLSNTTICNIDVHQDPFLKNQFDRWLSTDVPANKLSAQQPSAAPQKQSMLKSLASSLSFKTKKAAEPQATSLSNLEILTRFSAEPNFREEGGSLNAIQEEIEMHVSLAARVLEKASNPPGLGTPQQWAEIRTQAAFELNQQVRRLFQQAVIAAYQPSTNTFDYAALNKTLDQARNTLSATHNAYPLLMRHAEAQLGGQLYDHFEQKSARKQLSKHAFEATTASSNDYLSSTSLGLTARIEGSENTSHHKEGGLGAQAIRMIRYSDGSFMMRLPSIPDSKSDSFSPSSAQHINDTALKIHEATDYIRHSLPGYDGPIILNRETAIPGPMMEALDNNQQRKRVDIEMQAVHLVNATKTPQDYVFLQNLSVNGHSQDLSYATSGTLKEATLMAEMAMLANLRYQAKTGVLGISPSALEQDYAKVIRHYQNYLANPKGKSFSDSPHGALAQGELARIKTKLQTATLNETTDLKVLANQALLKIFANEAHYDQNLGMLIQSLSTYTQNATIAGCKSANERFAAVEGRATLFRLINLEPCPLPDAKAKITAALQACIQEPSLRNIYALKDTVDDYHNKHTLQIRMAAAVSTLDQGGGAKLKAFSSEDQSEFNTNVAESHRLDRLHTKGTSPMQAHSKDQNHAKDLLNAVDNGRQIYQANMKTEATDRQAFSSMAPLDLDFSHIEREMGVSNRKAFHAGERPDLNFSEEELAEFATITGSTTHDGSSSAAAQEHEEEDFGILGEVHPATFNANGLGDRDDVSLSANRG